MLAEIILIPKESADADISKQCAQYVARSLASVGITVRDAVTICQTKPELQKAVAQGLNRSKVVLIIGGLDRRQSFNAKMVISAGLRLHLAENAACVEAIKAYCEKSGESFSNEDIAYACLPQGSLAFPNQHGKIPGCAISAEKQHIILMPDSQTEAMAMMGTYILPFLSGAQSRATVTRVVRTYGIVLEQARAILCELLDGGNPIVSMDMEGEEVVVRVSAQAASPGAAAQACMPILRQVIERLGDAAYGLDVDCLEAALVSKLKRKGLDISVAEAGCDGMFARVISETSLGAQVLRYAIQADSGEDKISMLGIPKSLVKKHHGLSEQIAVYMADCARRKGHSAIGVAICSNTTDDRSKKRPIGLVYIAVCDANNVYVKKLVVGSGDPMERDLIIDAAVSRSLNMARLFVDYLPGAYNASIPLQDALNGASVTDKQFYNHDGQSDISRRGKKNLLRRLGGNFIIRKADEPKVKVRKILFILAVLVFIGSAGYVGRFYLNSHLAASQARQFYQIFNHEVPSSTEISADFPAEFLTNFAGLWEINQDVVAYINIPGTGVQYPIVQGIDNDFYLRRDFFGRRNEHGIPFMDFRVDISRPSDNIVVYGHNMRDGQIFGELLSYQDVEFYRQHPIIRFSTLHEHAYFKIFSVFITNGHEDQGPMFRYHDFIESPTPQDFESFVRELRIRSLINAPVEVEPGDVLLTLSTCTYEFTEARFVVVARRVRDGESTEVPVHLAERNRQPLFPDIWYETFGGSRPIGLETIPIVTTSASSYNGDGGYIRNTLRNLLSQAPIITTLSVPRFTNDAQSGARQSIFDNNTRSAQPTQANQSFAQGSSFFRPGAPNTSTPFFSSGGNRGAASHNQSSASVLSVTWNGQMIEGDALDIVSRIVQNEMGPRFHREALKAQAVAAYSYVRYHNGNGRAPTVYMSDPTDTVISAVREVIGQAVFFEGRIAMTPYHATSAGMTKSSSDIWGGHLPYLVSVDSSYCRQYPNFSVAWSFTSNEVADRLEARFGFRPSGSPDTWLRTINHTEGGYNNLMSISGQTTNLRNGAAITGRAVREALRLRSASFTVQYDRQSDRLIFTQFGHGHGVGLPQNGADFMARAGWSYDEILMHYFPGTVVR